MNPVINGTRVLAKILQTTKRIVVLRGGSGSSKTFSMCQLMLNWLLTGKVTEDLTVEKGVWSVVRRHSTTLDKSVLRDFQNIVGELEIGQFLKYNKTVKTYEYQGRILEFFGADDEQKLRGGRRDLLYCNEANELSYSKEFLQLNMRTKQRVFIDFNPDDQDAWMNIELEQKRKETKGDVEVIKSTYHDNQFLSKPEIEEIENLKNIDPMLWKIYGEGEYGKMQGLVFEDWNEVERVPEEANLVGYGCDFGYSSDPTSVIAVYLFNNEIYANEILYETGLTNPMIAKALERKGINKNDEIWADSAEPKSIQEIYEYGFNIQPVTKGADSIRFGIDTIKQYKLNVTSNSLNLIRELRHYKWAEDKEGKATNKPIDLWNHGIDSLRYLCLMRLAKQANVTPVIKFI